ncbi:MAG: hypothetical protein N3B16_04895 [Candidatus Aminicenantes bacterium]|nr:hypothetical protein [Candidatus Aminicenantes bacterium]
MKETLKSKMVVALLAIPILLSLVSGTFQAQSQQYQIEKAKIFQETYPVITESDLYCSYFVLENDLPSLRVIGAERQAEKILLSDDDIVFINAGKASGLEIGQLFFLVEVLTKVDDYGYLACKRGRVRIISCEPERSVGRIEKSCGHVTIGNFLFPYQEREGLIGRDLGFEPYGTLGRGPIGQVIFQENEFVQIASGHWAIINLGKEDGLEIGQQLTIYKKVSPQAPREAIANAIVIDLSRKTATIRILSAKDAIFKGYEVQAK